MEIDLHSHLYPDSRQLHYQLSQTTCLVPTSFLETKNYLSLFQTQLKPLKDFYYIYSSCIGAITGSANNRMFLKLYILLYVLPKPGRPLSDFAIALHLLLYLACGEGWKWRKGAGGREEYQTGNHESHITVLALSLLCHVALGKFFPL